MVDLLSRGLAQTKSSTVIAPAQPHPQIYTSTPPTPLLTSVLVMGVPTTSQSPIVVVPTMGSTSGVNESAPPKAKLPKISDDSQHHHITPTLVGLSLSISTSSLSTSVGSFLVVVVPELAIPAETYPECINRPGGGKDYLCHLCLFRNFNLDTVLTHVRKHLDVTTGCPVCGKHYQNAASLCKHGRDVHDIQIVNSSTSLSFPKGNYKFKIVLVLVVHMVLLNKRVYSIKTLML